jgi:CRISPR-associated endonuclease/helicase Cas3
MKHQLNLADFSTFFKSLYQYDPFPWQTMLLEQVANSPERWPDLIDLPTASGKTACIDIAVFALAMGVPTPRRIWFVVDRRIVVDEAYRRAEKLALYLKYVVSTEDNKLQLEADFHSAPILNGIRNVDDSVLRKVAENLNTLGGSAPLEVGRLRGGVPRSIAWAGNPAQPALITSTIDQIGSRLLFRGYGVSEYAWPIHAALAGTDSLIILDEAHLARPFYQTVSAIQRYRSEPWASEPLPSQFKLVVMSATPPCDSGDTFARFPKPNERDKALDHPKLHERRSALKPTELAIAKKPKIPKEFNEVDEDELVLDASVRVINFVAIGRKRIAVMVNRVKTARNIAKQLQHLSPVLITGRLRPIDRDDLIAEYESKLKAGSTETLDKPIVLVTTQCLEVGADFSFDALITECASLDALRQRFGRLARLGTPVDSPGVILIRKADIEPKEPDPIYGPALPATWKWLEANADTANPTSIQMGIDALDPKLPSDLSPYRAPQLCAPILLPAYLDLLCQTSPRPSIEPDVALFLHGIPPADERVKAEVRIVWRNFPIVPKDTPTPLLEDIVTELPPLSGEMLAVPLAELRRMLETGRIEIDSKDSDVEGGFDPVPSREPTKSNQASTDGFVVWRGTKCDLVHDSREIKPNDVVVLPGDHPTFRQLVLYPAAKPDIYERAYHNAHGVIRKLYAPETSDEEIEEADIIEKLKATLSDVDKALFKIPRLIEYAPRLFHVTGKIPRIPVDAWESDTDEDDLLHETNGRHTLQGHTNDVVRAAAHLARILPNSHTDAIRTAAILHDIGKADTRFQFVLNRGRRVDPGNMRAKSSLRLSRADEQKLYQRSGLPKGFRHEFLSTQMALLQASSKDHPLRDLILHLIASHHGRCRSFADVIVDANPGAAECSTVNGQAAISIEQRQSTALHSLDSYVAERFWKLIRHYGWWGLAYLESILRCADTHASAYAEKESR